MGRRKRSRNNGNQRWDVQTSGRLLLALNESAGTNPTPQQIIDAVGATLKLDACGIFPTRSEEDASIAVYFRTGPLRDAFIQAYTEKTVGVHTTRRMSMGGVCTTIEEWEGPPLLPGHIEELLHSNTWSTAIQLFYNEEVVGLLWMVGSPEEGSRPPSKEVLQSIAQLATLAFQQTVARALAMSDNDELQLLEELNAILTQQRPFAERLQAVVERAREATGFTSVGLATRSAKTAKSTNAAAMAVHESAYSQDYIDWAVQYYATDEALDESQRFFQGRSGPLLFANPAQLATVEEENKRWLVQNSIRFFVQIPLTYGDQHLGTLRICSTFSETETWERLRVFTALAGHIAAILKSVRLFDESMAVGVARRASATVRPFIELKSPFWSIYSARLCAATSGLWPEMTV
ncbi:MAG: GAF domain-containing protein, partial [Chloroflexi bacterium]|nr:GAF domain-containing protein [Chloroflexota bacterium]